MEQLGDKIAAKIARKAKVPVIEGAEINTDDVSEIKSFARKIGFPVMVLAGGGGRGMRVVRGGISRKKFLEAQEALKHSMTTNFIEKFIDSPKHIEVQILADQHGNIVHLYEEIVRFKGGFKK